MTNLEAARAQMAMSLGFHIVFAAIGIALPVMMAIAEWRWLRTGEQVSLTLAKRWAKGSAILFAVGAVSGTVLSFELGLLWPAFMEWAGPMIGPLFALEGFAFFTEAIFLGVYLYGWRTVRPWVHWLAGVVVAASGAVSAVFVVAANGWMNSPTGFRLLDGRPIDVDPIAAMLNPSAIGQAVHMLLAAYIATGFAVAGIHAFLLLRDPGNLLNRRALAIALVVGGLPALVQPVSGDLLAKAVADHQPVKLAAFEGLYRTQAAAPFHLGGIPDPDQPRLRYSLEIPGGLSLLLYGNPGAVVRGLDSVPRDEWPPVGVVHVAFQLMVAAGFALAGLTIWTAWVAWKGRALWTSPWLLRALVAATPLGFLAIEAGWVVTEVGRQPWIIYGIMRTSDAVTPMPGLIIPLAGFTGLYFLLAGVVVWLIRRHVRAATEAGPAAA